MNNLIKNLNTLLEIKQLKDNWDQDGAEKFTESLIKKAREIVANLEDKQPEGIFPTARESIQLEYSNKLNRDDYLEFEIFEDNITSFCIKNKNYISKENLTIEKMKSIINDFFN